MSIVSSRLSHGASLHLPLTRPSRINTRSHGPTQAHSETQVVRRRTHLLLALLASAPAGQELATPISQGRHRVIAVECVLLDCFMPPLSAPFCTHTQPWWLLPQIKERTCGMCKVRRVRESFCTALPALIPDSMRSIARSPGLRAQCGPPLPSKHAPTPALLEPLANSLQRGVRANSERRICSASGSISPHPTPVYASQR